MTNEIVKIDAPELQGIDQSKSNQIKATFEPMTKMLSEFEEDYNAIILESKNGITKELSIKAKTLRLKVGKVRIKTGDVKDKQKEYIKLEDRAIMGVHNIIVWAVKEKEDTLKAIENYAAIQEQKRLDYLQIERAEKLSLYIEDAHERDLVKFADDEFEALLAMKKKEQEDRIASEKKAEEDRITKEKAEAEDRERVLKENEQLKKEAKERDRLLKIATERTEKRNTELHPYIVFIRDYNKMLTLSETEYKKEFADIKIGAEDHWEYERKEEADRIEKERKEREDKTKIEREEKVKIEKLESELKAKKDADRKAKDDEYARLQLELNKGDTAKVEDLIADFEALKIKYTFESSKNKKMYTDVGALISKITLFIKK